MEQTLSPKQVARAIGVSESTLKRWCDQGLLATVRTAGGHRRLQLCEVLRFARDTNRTLVSPDAIGLPSTTVGAERGISRGREMFIESILAGDEERCRRLVIDLYLAKHSVSVICDQVIAAAFQAIGHKWACQEAEVYQERRGCEIVLRVLYELRSRVVPTHTQLLALGGSIEGDYYAVPTTMAELVLRSAGWNAVSLGTCLPIKSLARSLAKDRPSLFWLSVSHIADSSQFLAEYSELFDCAEKHNVALVVGGRALVEGLRQQMRYSAYCDTMQQLEVFGVTLRNAVTGEAT